MMQLRHSQPAASSLTRRHPAWLLAAFWMSVVIAIAVVIRRLVALIRPSSDGPPQMEQLDAVFSSHAALTVAHIVPAAIFVLLAVTTLLRRSPGVWHKRLFYLFGLIVGATAYMMNAYAVGGWVERSAVLIFNTWFLTALARGYWFGLRGDAAAEREWTTRAIGVLLGIATTRPVMAIFFATSTRTHLTPTQFFGIAFWIGFSLNTIAVELWLRSNGARLNRRPESR